MTTIQNLAPIVPFIEPTEPLELSAIFQQDQSNKAHQSHRISQDRKGKAIATDQSEQSSAVDHVRKPSEEEATIEKTRRELEDKISELNKLKNQLAQTEERARELASRIPA